MTATFTLSNKDDRLKLRFEKPILFEMSGAAFIYELDPPNHVEKESSQRSWNSNFPGSAEF